MKLLSMSLVLSTVLIAVLCAEENSSLRKENESIKGTYSQQTFNKTFYNAHSSFVVQNGPTVQRNSRSRPYSNNDENNQEHHYHYLPHRHQHRPNENNRVPKVINIDYNIETDWYYKPMTLDGLLASTTTVLGAFVAAVKAALG